MNIKKLASIALVATVITFGCSQLFANKQLSLSVNSPEGETLNIIVEQSETVGAIEEKLAGLLGIDAWDAGTVILMVNGKKLKPNDAPIAQMLRPNGPLVVENGVLQAANGGEITYKIKQPKVKKSHPRKSGNGQSKNGQSKNRQSKNGQYKNGNSQYNDQEYNNQDQE